MIVPLPLSRKHNRRAGGLEGAALLRRGPLAKKSRLQRKTKETGFKAKSEGSTCWPARTPAAKLAQEGLAP